ncbi:MAG: hypothetical protein IKV27_00070 [Lachnospiraceae bacterium]|jgi:hypothetical protein|nr:hypothetical protein [Lachnospiraceae bacterium]
MLRKVLSLLICLILVLNLPVTAKADIGPKPSVRITFTGIKGETYYGTLLSERRSTGPATAWDGYEEYRDWKPESEKPIWEKFIAYEDTDGYYFLQEWWDCSETNQLNWTYYPPTPFKILLYFPETDSFYVSDIYERYAFDSYFSVDLSEYATSPITARQSYDYTWEVISLVARIVLTIALELAIALLFGYREKKALGFLAIVNVITQVVLNVALNIINYRSGSMGFTFAFICMEILVFAIEAITYKAVLHRYSEKEKVNRRGVTYALVANTASFAIGLWLAHLIPGIF